MKEWFLSRHGSHGRIEGPFDDDGLRALLKRGEATYLDFVYSAEDRRWKSLAELSQFNPALSTLVLTETPAEWIVLHTGLDGVQSQEGPFTAAMVIERIERGELRYSDRAWRNGEPSWTPIFERPELNPGMRTLADAGAARAASSAPSSDELLKSVVRIERAEAPASAAPSGPSEEEAPWGTDGIDLASPPCYFKFVLALCLLFGFSASIEAAAETKPRAKVLDFTALKTNTEQGVLAFQTDAAVEETIKVVIRARPGDVLEVPSYHKVVQVSRQPGEVPSLQLAPLKLPPGRYQIEAILGDLRREKAVNVGSHGEEFEKAMARHIKSFSLKQQTEKKALFYSARRFEALAKSLGDGYQRHRRHARVWSQFFRRWNTESRSARKKILEIAGTGRQELIYPEEIRGVQAAIERLDEEAKTLDEAVRQKRDVASDNSSRLVKDFGRLKSTVAEMHIR